MTVRLTVTLSEVEGDDAVLNAIQGHRTVEDELEISILNFAHLRHLAHTGHLIYEYVGLGHLHLWPCHGEYFRPNLG